MRKYLKFRFCLFFVCFVSVASLSAQQVKEISVLANKQVAVVQPTMWGVFFEDINFAADGGLYAELVKNRSFEFSLPMMGWKQVRQNGDGRLMTSFYSPANSGNPRFLTMVVDAESGAYGLSNEGFGGMGIKEDLKYNFSVKAGKSAGQSIKMKI